MMPEVLDELHAWLRENWDPAMPLGQWWERLVAAGWAAGHFPTEWFGRGLDPGTSGAITRAIYEFGAVPPPIGIGPNLAAPTVVEHGNDDQRRRLVPGMLNGSEGYCQLFSEPNAGSDLAGLQCRAEQDGDDYVVNGQKIWTSSAHIATKAMLLARTNVEVPKHAGISYFIVDLRQPGVEVRPIREMTGRALFNEVFLTDVRVSAADLVGGAGDGWAVANTTLRYERGGGGPIGGMGSSVPVGPLAGNLTRPAGECREEHHEDQAFPPPTRADELAQLARSLGCADDPLIRQALVKLWTRERVLELTGQRVRGLAQRGEQLPGLPQLAKMAMNHLVRTSRDVTFQVLGSRGTLFGYHAGAMTAAEQASGVRELGRLVETALFASAPPIYGGSDQIQRNILAERALGLPREPGDDRSVPFKDLRKN